MEYARKYTRVHVILGVGRSHVRHVAMDNMEQNRTTRRSGPVAVVKVPLVMMKWGLIRNRASFCMSGCTGCPLSVLWSADGRRTTILSVHREG